MANAVITSEADLLSDPIEVALLQRVESGQIELPLLPDVTWQVMEMTRSDDADIRKISEVVHRDPSLASHVLRVANSPAFLSRMPITSLQQAISRLGIRQLSEIVFASSLQSQLFKAPGYEEEIQSLWTHSVSTAVYAGMIARQTKRNVEGAFLCGLLHDIGKAVIIQQLIEIESDEAAMLIPSALDALVETHHTHVGGKLAQQWSLPNFVSETILLHHDDPIAPDCSDLVAVTRMADLISEHLMKPEDVTEETIYQHSVLASLNLSTDDVTGLLDQRERVQKLAEAMSSLS
jgi:putative nucleotidyltransferase with HDIG domain